MIDEVPGLIGVPSRHYDPLFARIAIQAIDHFQPTVVALELPCCLWGEQGEDVTGGLTDELDWAASCWPTPMVSATASQLFPFVPGDSIFEAFRRARENAIQVALVDLPSPSFARQNDQHKPVSRGSSHPLPDVEWSVHDSTLFLHTLDAVLGQTPPDERDLAREAWMAAHLQRLLRDHQPVLWVGGMAHWTRIVNRLRTSDFSSPATEQSSLTVTRRMRLAPSALYRMTGRLAWLVQHYAASPDQYDEQSAIRTLAQSAAQKVHPESDELDCVLVGVNPGSTGELPSNPYSTEPIASVDVAKMLIYARNLAATSGPRVRPDFTELLTSSAMIINPWYAGRLYVLAMREQAGQAGQDHAPLEFEYKDGREIYHSNGEIIDAHPWQPELGGSVLTITEIRRRAREDHAADLPTSGKRGRKNSYWVCEPQVEDGYTAFLEFLLRRASQSDVDEAPSSPFQAGLRDGIDVRATVRNWTNGDIHVREPGHGRIRLTNGAIDWTGTSEYTDILQGRVRGGWIDPNLLKAGSCSRETNTSMQLLSKDPWKQLQHREFTLFTLDCPNHIHR